jgi:uncharacterized protein YndB with AHSA1/START domain
MRRTDVAPERREILKFEYELEAPPARVWRALTIPEYVARWLTAPAIAPERELPKREGAGPSRPQPVSLRLLDCEPNRSVRYSWAEEASPFMESVVTFRLAANEMGGTTFSIVHELGVATRKQAANSNRPMLLLAA